MAAVAVLAVAVVFLGYRRLLFATFDPAVADVSGVGTARVDALLMSVLAATILVTMQVLGVTLIAAALVIPPATARMLTDSFNRMLALSTLIGSVSGAVGMIASYHLDVQSGPSIVLTAALAFGVVYLVTGTRGLRRAKSLGIEAHEGAAGSVPVR